MYNIKSIMYNLTIINPIYTINIKDTKSISENTNSRTIPSNRNNNE